MFSHNGAEDQERKWLQEQKLRVLFDEKAMRVRLEGATARGHRRCSDLYLPIDRSLLLGVVRNLVDGVEREGWTSERCLTELTTCPRCETRQLVPQPISLKQGQDDKIAYRCKKCGYVFTAIEEWLELDGDK